MFNSALIDISQKINDGIFDRYNPIVEEVYNSQFKTAAGILNRPVGT